METRQRFGKGALILGIVIVLNMFFNYAISLVYKMPDYSAYFPQSQVIEPTDTQAQCIAVGGQWTVENAVVQNGYCNPDYTKQQRYTAAQNTYDRTIFIILVVLGILSIGVGAISKQEVLTAAFSWGGVLSLLIASCRYWSNANDIVHVLILAVALGALIWIAVKKFNTYTKPDR